MLYNRINYSTIIHRGILISVMVSLISTLVGCGIFSSSSNEEYTKKSISETEITIYSSFEDQFFYKFYGNYLVLKYPDVKFRLIQAKGVNPEEVAKEIRENKPDLVITWKDNFRELQKQNMLTDLNAFVENTDMNLENYYPEMINFLKNDSEQLNGLSPLVTPSVIFYNKSLFDINKIAYPINQMSWDEMLLLTERFTGSGTVGLTGKSPSSVLRAISQSKALEILDNKTGDLVFNSQEWINAIQIIIDSSREGNLVNDSGELFLEGNAAMYYGTLNLIPKLLENNSLPWGVVTTPVDPLNRDKSSDIYFYDIFCIPEEAPQQEAAWEMIQALLSQESVAYIQDNSVLGSVSTLNKFMNSQYGNVDLSAIWMQKIDDIPYLSSKLPRSFKDKFDDVVYAVLARAVQNQNMTASECFKEIEDQTRVLYQEELQSKR